MNAAHALSPWDFDRYLLVDDTDDDVGEILTVLCERSGARVGAEFGHLHHGGAE